MQHITAAKLLLFPRTAKHKTAENVEKLTNRRTLLQKQPDAIKTNAENNRLMTER